MRNGFNNGRGAQKHQSATVPNVDYVNSDTGCKVTIELLRTSPNEYTLDKSLGVVGTSTSATTTATLSSASMSNSYNAGTYPASHGISGSST